MRSDYTQSRDALTEYPPPPTQLVRRLMPLRSLLPPPPFAVAPSAVRKSVCSAMTSTTPPQAYTNDEETIKMINGIFEAKSQPVMVEANPGTGKTHLIALFCQMTDAETIDAYSYTNPAAQELIDRGVFRASTLRE